MSFIAALLMALGEPSALPTEPPTTKTALVLPAAPGSVMPGQDQPTSPVASYAARERIATDLEQFRGGSAGLVVLIVVVVAVLVLVAILIPW
ncbi:MAG: hypothetical protein JO332_12225 [Planctomycetaceae bacterium]|nr:hypothetical protein [Planctomycetaceae bacterium]